jgi:hypothetical protein
MINVLQAKKKRGMHTYKEPSRHKDTMMCAAGKEKERHAPHIQGDKKT